MSEKKNSVNVDDQVVLKVAKLARLRMDESEYPQMQLKLQNILKHFEILQDLNTDGVEPLFHMVDSMPLREDVAEAPLNKEELLKNAPDSFEDCFRIPRVMGGTE